MNEPVNRVGNEPGRRIGTLIEGQTLISLGPGESIQRVAETMAEHNIGAVAIVVDGALAGIFTERDLLKRVVATGLSTSTPVSEVMTRNIISIEPGDEVEDAIVTMTIKGFRHMPVIDGGKLVAMLSFRDLLQADRERIRDKASLLSRLVRQDPIYDG